MISAFVFIELRGEKHEYDFTDCRRPLYPGALLRGAVAAVFFVEPFARIWLKRELMYGRNLIFIMAIYVIAQMFANNYASFLNGVGHIKVSVIISVIGTIINIPLSVLFAHFFGMRLSGIILGSLCVMAVSTVVLPMISHRWIVVKSKEWKVEDGKNQYC